MAWIRGALGLLAEVAGKEPMLTGPVKTPIDL